MKKWVIKKLPYVGGKLEVWEYIDTVEEAMKYWYVAEAIKKYGEDKVVPLAMNRNGGYHHLLADSNEIVRIVEADTEPDLPLNEQYIADYPGTRDGWMGQDGTVFCCGTYGHIDCAKKICGEYHIQGEIWDESLLNEGWIKIMGGKWFGRWDKINDIQIVKLEKLGIKSTSEEMENTE